MRASRNLQRWARENSANGRRNDGKRISQPNSEKNSESSRQNNDLRSLSRSIILPKVFVPPQGFDSQQAQFFKELLFDKIAGFTGFQSNHANPVILSKTEAAVKQPQFSACLKTWRKLLQGISHHALRAAGVNSLAPPAQHTQHAKRSGACSRVAWANLECAEAESGNQERSREIIQQPAANIIRHMKRL